MKMRYLLATVVGLVLGLSIVDLIMFWPWKRPPGPFSAVATAKPSGGVTTDWPQWRGPERDGVSKETGLLKTWPKDGPPLVWTNTNAGIGYSGPAIVGDKLYCMGARGETEYVFALDIKKKGEEIWSAKIGPMFTWKDGGNYWNAGPSATPAVDGELIYALGGQGILVCVDLSGKERWRKDLPKELAAEVNPVGGGPEKIGWGFNWSPLVDGEQLICVPGGRDGLLAALNKKTGELLWRTKDLPEQATYSSPIVAEVNGVKQYITMTMQGVAAVAAKDGKLLWHYKRKQPYKDVVIPTPIFHDKHIFTTVGYRPPAVGCDLIKLPAKGAKIEPEYSNKNMVNRYGGVVLVGDHLYGYSEKPNEGWTYLEFKTGQVKWTERRALGRGSVVFADGHLYCYTEEEGVVALVEASPEGWKEKSRFEIPKKSTQRKSSGKIWTHPVIADGKLYLRDQELLFCYDIKEHAGTECGE